MKITGLILVIIGLIGGAISVMQIVQPFGTDPATPAATTGVPGFVGLALPLVLCIGAIAIGLLMVMYGGRGYIISDNPRVRN